MHPQLSLLRSFTTYQLPVLAGITALGPFAIDAYLPAFPAIAVSLNVDPVQLTQTVSAYFVGLAVGQLLGGPMSDQIGRRPVALFGLVLFGITSLLIVMVGSLGQMLVMRLLQAVGGGLSAAVVIPTIRDVSSFKEFPSRAALVFTLLLIAPIVAPIAGTLLLRFSWHWIFLSIGCYALLVLCLYAAGVPESNQSRVGSLSAKPVLAAFWRVAKHRFGDGFHPIRYGIAYSLSFSILFTYLANSSFFFQTYFGASPDTFTALFALMVGFVAIVQLSSARYLRGRSLDSVARLMRIGFAAQLIVLTATFLLLFADPSLWIFFVFLTISLSLFGIIVPASIGVYMAPFKESSGAATAITTTLGYLLGAVLGSLSGLLNRGDLFAGIGIMLGASLLANAVLFSIRTKTERDALNALQDGREPAI